MFFYCGDCVNKEKLLNDIPNVPHKGLLKRLILQAPNVDWLNNAIEENNLIIPKSYWEEINSEID